MRALPALILIGAGLCAGAAANAADSAAEVTVALRKASFEPALLPVAAGTTVAWTNDDDIPHSVTADDKRFDSGALAPGQTFRWRAEGSGRISYHCIFHPSMAGALDVAPAGGEKPGG